MKYSRQRELILNYVQLSDEHPTADMVYLNIRKELSNISLGTVYRNLNKLCEVNLIKKITMPNNSDRFDKTVTNHCHMYCNNCNMVYDIFASVLDNLNNVIEKETGNKVKSHEIVLTGICKDCSEKLERKI